MAASCWNCVVLLLLAYTTDFGWCSSSVLAKEKEVLNNILGPGRYDARIRPSGVNGTDGPVLVSVNTYIRSIDKIDDIKMEYTLQLTFRQSWMDERLKFDSTDGKLKYLTFMEPRIWMPDLFFSNEKRGHFHNLLMPNMYFRIFPSGSVLYSIRLSLTLSCPMNLKLFPLDRQVCSLRMASYGWTTDELVFLWKEGDPVQVTNNLHLPHFILERVIPDYCNTKTSTGEYSCIKVDFSLKRVFCPYLIQVYIPCCMLVFVSWICFWLDQNDTMVRFFISLTTLLTLAIQTSSVNATFPTVSYTKAIDVWTGISLTFVFGALLECVLVNYGLRFELRRRKQASSSGTDAKDGGITLNMKPVARHQNDAAAPETERILSDDKGGNWIRSWLSKFATRSKLIDMISRIAFPVAFALFNIIYWSSFLFRG